MLRGVNPDEEIGEPRRVLVWNGKTIRATPPVLVWMCWPPTGSTQGLPCCMPTKECQGPHVKCPDCKFRFCDYHFLGHRGSFGLPRKFWKAVYREVCRQMNAIAASERKRPSSKSVMKRALPMLEAGDEDGG